MHKKLFLPFFLLFAMLGGTVKAAPAMPRAHSIGVVVNDTIIDDDEEIVENILINQPVEYPGGAAALCDFINRDTRFRYPQVALKNKTQGDAIVEFCVKEDGSVNDIFMLKSLSPECDQALMDAVSSLRRFFPAKLNGRYVPCWFVLSVSFKLEDTGEDEKTFGGVHYEELPHGDVIVDRDNIKWSYCCIYNFE